MNWTPYDERLLQVLQERRNTHRRTLEECVERCVLQHFYEDMSSEQITLALIENATQIRKVLEPFDPEFVK